MAGGSRRFWAGRGAPLNLTPDPPPRKKPVNLTLFQGGLQKIPFASHNEGVAKEGDNGNPIPGRRIQVDASQGAASGRKE
mgnify:CR=1 FL=1